jgi:hypothetical protein
VLEGDTPGMEADGSIRVAARITVFQVATDGTTDVRQLATNLMVPSRKQLDL